MSSRIRPAPLDAPTAERGRPGMLPGMLLAAGAAMLFASKGLYTKWLYARGIGFETLVVLRAMLSLPLFWAFAAHRSSLGRISATPTRAAAAAALGGFTCFYVGAMADFYALTLIGASVERALLFSYPAMVVMFGAVLTRRLPGRATVGAVLLTYVGIFLVIGGFDPAALRANWLGASCVLLSAVSFVVYFMLGERYTREIGAARFALFAMGGAAVASLIHGLVRSEAMRLGDIPAEFWLLLIAFVVACNVVPILMQAEGVRRIGAERAALVSTVGPPTTALLAWLLLGESLNGWQIAGIGLILLGVLLLDLMRPRRRPT